jgi:serine phosphatase RsbU (regulator of sigma subunit)
MARRVQRVMIPPQQLPAMAGLEIAWDYQPVMQVGGDVLDVIELDGRRVLLFIGDAMGHGVQAALVMSVVKTALRNAAEARPEPSEVLWAVNRVVCEMLGDSFITAGACLLDAASGRCDVSLAGHAKPFIFRAAGGQIDRPGEAGLPLGVESSGAYTCHSVQLDGGDVLVLNTDGIVEAPRQGAPNAEYGVWGPRPEEMYGEERLAEQIHLHGRDPAKELVAAVMADVRNFCADKPQEDDFTILVARRVQ